ncbi:Zn-ribbon domain-containing OB-fold protein [Pseudomonas sp. NFX15]|uniref:Zn-ribbon domain-containing OB-fold protein n=1 Tax=Pseudomonas sp. NFX15 TaxID=2816958 RepID=UPI003B8CD2FF
MTKPPFEPVAHCDQDISVLRPYPQITAGTEEFWSAGALGLLKLQRCQSCSCFIHPPAPLCPRCLSDEVELTTVSGRAHVATFTVNHHLWHPAFTPPYILAIVEFDDAPGVRLTTRLIGVEISEVRIGLPVRVCFEQVGPTWLPLFTPEVE